MRRFKEFYQLVEEIIMYTGDDYKNDQKFIDYLGKKFKFFDAMIFVR
jgi:hypothetical protein